MNMKKFILIILCVCFCFLTTACENETVIRTAHISETTGALSTDYSIKLVVDEDERLEDKYADVQIKASVEGQVLNFNEENKKPVTLVFAKKDYWYNLTYLIDMANGVSAEGDYVKYKEFGNHVYMFTSNNDVDLTFRVVAGQIKENPETKEKILVLSEEVSEEVTVNVKKHKEK